jgi:hypothetical protein
MHVVEPSGAVWQQVVPSELPLLPLLPLLLLLALPLLPMLPLLVLLPTPDAAGGAYQPTGQA